MHEDTLAAVFGVDVAIGSLPFEGEDVRAIVPVRLSDAGARPADQSPR